jgi:Rieske Fe-S protein
LIVGGEDHRSGEQLDEQGKRYAALEAWARERFPMAAAVRYRWSGQVFETIDGLAFIGRAPGEPDNVYIATGDSGMGMTHGTIAGMLLSDLITGHENAWAALYDPSRKPVRAAGEYLKENLHSAGHVVDWFSRGDVKSVDEIAIDSGAVVRRGMKKLAIYRDPHGQLHERSAKCPHLGCVVSWNDGEKTWDCPCHGLRFDCFGEVLIGPANSGLAPAHAAEDEHDEDRGGDKKRRSA